MHALVTAVLLRVTWFDAFDRNPEPEPPDREFGQVKERIGTCEGNAVVSADGVWQTELLEDILENSEGIDLLSGLQGFAGNQVTAGEVGDGQRIAVAAIGQHELALVVGAPQIIGLIAGRQRRASGFVAPMPPALDQPMAIQDGMHRTDRRGMDIRIKPCQSFPYLRRSPVRPLLLAAYDQRLDRNGELVSMPVRSPRAIGQPFHAAAVIAIEDLVASLPRDAEPTAESCHLLSVQKPGNELQPFIHRITLLPGHFALLAKSPIV